MLVPICVGAGCGTRLYRLLIIAFFVYFSHSTQSQGRRRLLKSGPAMGRRKRSPSAEGTRRREHERGFPPLIMGLRGDLAREKFRFRKAAHAFLLHLECHFGLYEGFSGSSRNLVIKCSNIYIILSFFFKYHRWTLMN